ncbi:uncharacterized protein [Misgurnus anguillicaudatus]|uniref:uncharacterized protein n=1 Tax=Misgurnus anguillicaudatus TaxID=75329 RepID=UPI003CCF2D7C
MPKLKRFRMRRKAMINKSKKDDSDTTVCKCPNVLPILVGNTVRMQSAIVNEDVIGAACSLVSIVKHKIHNVCTWQKLSLEDINAEGTKLVKDIAKCKGYGKTLLPFKLSEQYCIFNKMCKVSEGQSLTRGHEELYETLQEIFLNYESCLVQINRQTCAIIRCRDVYAVVDCNIRDACGLGSNIGTAVVVFNTNWQDLFWHVNNLMESLSANTFRISGINVEVTLPDMLPCVNNDVVVESSSSNVRQSVCSLIHQGDSRFKEVPLPDMLSCVNSDVVQERSTSNARQSVCGSIHQGDSKFKEVTSPDVLSCVNSDVVGREGSTSNARQSVCGSFHQGDSRLKWSGKQCVAISLAAMAMHSVHNVFSWETKDLDNVLTIGDNLYGYLLENNCISDPKPQKWLCVPDLPCEYVFNEKRFKFEYGKCVSGFVDINDGDLITAGVCVPLVHGLDTMFEQYETCFLTLNGNTCAIIKQNGQFAVIDSHARSTTGIPDSDGLSVIVYYNSLSCVLKHIENFAACVGGKMKEFEISGLHVIPEKSSKVSVRQSENKKKMGKKERSYCTEHLEDERESKVVKTKKEHFMESTTKTISDCDLNSDTQDPWDVRVKQ